MQILLIAIAITIITDLSGIVEYFKSHLYYKLRGTYNYPDSWDSPIIHLISCSFCQVWWVGLLYLILIHQVTIPAIAYLLVICYLTTTIKDLLVFFKEVLTKSIDKMFKILNDVYKGTD